MSSLIEVDKLIRMAKREGVAFGKGDPYNRLRYYTKIGWLPHMERKMSKSGEVVGHYPDWVLNRLVQIDKLKKQGANNEYITGKINTRNKLHTIYARMNTQEFRNKAISYATILIVFLILGLLGISGYFLYENFYQVITQSEEVSKLQRTISIESIDMKTFESVNKKLEEKKIKKDTSTIKNPFK